MREFWHRQRTGRPRDGAAFFTNDELRDVARFYGEAVDAPATPLVRLPALAQRLGIGELLVKDESARFGLQAFKITGVRYAVDRLVRDQGDIRALACATSGNHGRAVARTARLRRLPAHVFVPAGTAPSRIRALRSEGATVTVTDAGYDDAVRQMRREADLEGWTVVSDTGWDGYVRIPRWIMAGYTRLLDEAADAWRPAPPDVVIVQAGVGSLAGAVAGWLAACDPAARPALVVAEPVGSSSVRASLAAGRRVDLAACGPTEMVGLRCAEVSPVAWPALQATVDAAVGITESDMRDALAAYTRPTSGDPPVASAASGAASLAALLAIMRAPELTALVERLAISSRTRVLVFNTEGATDRV